MAYLDRAPIFTFPHSWKGSEEYSFPKYQVIKKIAHATMKVEVTKRDGLYDVNSFLEFTDSDLAEAATKLTFTGKG